MSLLMLRGYVSILIDIFLIARKLQPGVLFYYPRDTSLLLGMSAESIANPLTNYINQECLHRMFVAKTQLPSL